jgi:hypothetical protein
MRALLCLLTLAGSNLIVAIAQTPGNEHPIAASTRLRLTATIDPSSAKLNTPIMVRLALKNVSSKVVSIGDTSPEYDFELAVADSAGKEPPRTALGNRMRAGKFVLLRSNRIDIEPGQEVVSEIDVTKIYEITQPGTYFLRADHRNILPDPDAAHNSTVEESKRPIEKAFSSPIQFTVVP